MRELVIYTTLRLVLLVAAFAVVMGLWALVAGTPDVFWSLLIAFVVSGIGSYYVLNPQREAFARRVEARAQRASARLERMKAREDTD